MPGDNNGSVYSMGLLREVAAWSVPAAVAFALIGTAVSQDVRFGMSCLLGGAFDVGTLYWALDRTKGFDAHVELISGPLTSFFAFRIVVKALLLVAAAVAPDWLSVLGMAAGVVIVDLTLATAGSAFAAWHMFRTGHRTEQPKG